MPRHVLVPEPSRAMFDEMAPDRFVPLYYRFRPLSLAARVLRRLGRSEPPRLRLPDSIELAAVDALWLGSDVEISAQETERLLARLPRLSWVYSGRTGIDHLAESSFRRRGIPVSNTGTLSSVWVAEAAVACLVSQAKRLPHFRRVQLRRRHAAPRPLALSGMHVLVLGTGAVGAATARLCRGLGMRVTGASRSPERFAGAPRDYDAVVSLSVALLDSVREADAVVMGLPLTPETEGLVGPDVLGRMRRTATLVNLARPRLVDERALVRCLREGRIEAAWVSGLQSLSLVERLAAERLPSLFLTHYREASLAERPRLVFEQFVSLSDRQLAGEVGNRVI